MPFIEQVCGSSVAEDFTVHTVDGFGDLVTLFLGDVCHALAFGQETADKAVCVFV